MDTGVGGDSAGWLGLKAEKGWGNIAPQTKDSMQNYTGICGVEVEMEEEMAHHPSGVWRTTWRW